MTQIKVLKNRHNETRGEQTMASEWRCPCGKVLKGDMTDLACQLYTAIVCTNECSRPWNPGTLPSLMIDKARERTGRQRFTEKKEK